MLEHFQRKGSTGEFSAAASAPASEEPWSCQNHAGFSLPIIAQEDLLNPGIDRRGVDASAVSPAKDLLPEKISVNTVLEYVSYCFNLVAFVAFVGLTHVPATPLIICEKFVFPSESNVEMAFRWESKLSYSLPPRLSSPVLALEEVISLLDFVHSRAAIPDDSIFNIASELPGKGSKTKT